MDFETLKVSREGAVLFVEISAPPMNLLGPELVRDLVSLVQRAETDEGVKALVFKSFGVDEACSSPDLEAVLAKRGCNRGVSEAAYDDR